MKNNLSKITNPTSEFHSTVQRASTRENSTNEPYRQLDIPSRRAPCLYTQSTTTRQKLPQLTKGQTASRAENFAARKFMTLAERQARRGSLMRFRVPRGPDRGRTRRRGFGDNYCQTAVPCIFLLGVQRGFPAGLLPLPPHRLLGFLRRKPFCVAGLLFREIEVQAPGEAELRRTARCAFGKGTCFFVCLEPIGASHCMLIGVLDSFGF